MIMKKVNNENVSNKKIKSGKKVKKIVAIAASLVIVFGVGTFAAIKCNLFQFYKLVYPKLISRLPKPFQLIKGQRQDETPAHTALREAFVNALIHSDYSAPGSIIIECRAESFTFTNPSIQPLRSNTPGLRMY